MWYFIHFMTSERMSLFKKQALFFFFVLLLSESIFLAQIPRLNIEGSYLLKTAWGGTAPLNAFIPENDALGCHAVAFAQVLYFHRLAPNGKIAYQCSNGSIISEDFSDYLPKWDKFILDGDSAIESAESARETSRFLYYVASIIRKDFGTDQYVDYPNDFHKKAIESHFDCKVTAYSRKVTPNISSALREDPDIPTLLQAEVDSNRPAGFYYTNRKGSGHAVVIDGYTIKDEKTYFHVNFGWFGRSDGCYLLEEDLPRDTVEIALIMIEPTNE